ncbi:MAG: DNA-processing protein DprA, partial [Mycobacterium sp.]
MNEDELAWAYLSRVVEPPSRELGLLVASRGPVEAADRVKRGEVTEELARATEARRELDCAADDLDALARLGGRLLTPADTEWPLLAFTSFGGVPRERASGHAPLVLWVVGADSLVDVTERACSIVGTRASTSYGERMAADLGAGLAERDVAIVSGG